MDRTIRLTSGFASQASILTPAQILEISNYINAYRAKHGVQPLIWSDTIMQFSQSWANNLLSTNRFTHSGNRLFSENLASFNGYKLDMMALLKKSIDMWYAEISDYDFTKGGFSSATGHFTALVWKNSSAFGMGYAINTSTNSVIVVWNASPPGNIIGQFQMNVLPLVSSPISIPGTTQPAPIPTNPHLVKLYQILDNLTGNASKQIIIAQVNQLIKDMSS